MFVKDPDEMSNLYRGSSIDASYKIWVHLVKRFQGRIFLEIDQSETRILCGSHACLTSRDEMSNLYRGPSIDASTKFRFIWPSSFRGEDFQKSANQKQELPVAAMFANESG